MGKRQKKERDVTMKICKKCKKHVVNKAKICKYCGADVSKCKILKSQPSNSNSSKNSSSSHTLPSKNIEKKTEDAKLIDSKTIINTKIEENEKKGPKENKKNKEQTDKKKQAAKNTTPKISKKTAEKKIKNKPKQVKKSPKQKQNLKKIFAKATSLLKAKAKKSNVTPKKSKVKTTSPKAKTKKLKNTNQKSKPKKTQSKTKTNVISGLSYKFKNTTSKFFKKLLQILTIIKKFICKTVTTIYLFIKENLKKFKEFIIPILAKISKKIPINKTWIKTHKTALKRCTIVLGIILLLIGISVTSIATYSTLCKFFFIFLSKSKISSSLKTLPKLNIPTLCTTLSNSLIISPPIF